MGGTEPEVWITGVGAVTAAGPDAAALRTALLEGRPALRPHERLQGLWAGSAPMPAPSRESRRLDRAGARFLAAAREAWEGAGLLATPPTPERTGVAEGSSLGPTAELLEAAERAFGARRRPRAGVLVRCMAGAGGAAFAQMHGLSGPALYTSLGSVSAMVALGEATWWIRTGRADVVLAGGADCPLHPAVVEQFRIAGILSEDRESGRPCRPFDSGRIGTCFGEGAGVVVLEAPGHARRRAAEPLAVVRGYGLATDAHSMVAPDPEGKAVAAAARGALAGAPQPPDWVKAHGTGTRINDPAECRGLAAALGTALADSPLVGLKPLLGHCLGASGAVEAVATVLALRERIRPGTFGTHEPDPELPPCRISLETTRCDAREVLLLAEGFGGRAAALRLAAA